MKTAATLARELGGVTDAVVIALASTGWLPRWTLVQCRRPMWDEQAAEQLKSDFRAWRESLPGVRKALEKAAASGVRP